MPTRSRLIRKAASFPPGHPERKRLLARIHEGASISVTVDVAGNDRLLVMVGPLETVGDVQKIPSNLPDKIVDMFLSAVEKVIGIGPPHIGFVKPKPTAAAELTGSDRAGFSAIFVIDDIHGISKEPTFSGEYAFQVSDLNMVADEMGR